MPQRRYPSINEQWGKAETIGPTDPVRSVNLRTPMQEQDPILMLGDMLNLGGITGTGPAQAVSAMAPRLMREKGAGLLERLVKENKLNPDLLQALQAAQGKYPRLFGHVNDALTHEPAPFMDRLRELFGKTPKSPFPSHVRGATMGPIGSKYSTVMFRNDLKGADAYNVVAHELAHVAQQLRAPLKAQPRYVQAEKVFGYENNPYELNANTAGLNFVRRMFNKGK